MYRPLLFSAKFLKYLPVPMPNPTARLLLLYLPYLPLLEITCGVPEMLRIWAENQKFREFLSFFP